MSLDNRSQIRQVLVITLLLNLFVMGLKAVVGVLTGSLSLQADALHSVTDSANNILGLIANRLSSPKPDREHPYGHQKYEGVAALGIAAFLAIACFEILQGAIERIWHGGQEVRISGGQLWLLLLVLGVNIFVAFYERRVGERLKSPILIADAYHTMSDVWVTITVLGGLIGIWLGKQFNLPQLQGLDVILAFPVAFLVFSSGWTVLRANLPWLVDEMAVAPEAIHAIVIEVPGVMNCHSIASRGLLGRQIFIEMHLVVDAVDVERAHEITEVVESRLEERFYPVRVVIHLEPLDYQSDQISFNNHG
ncbi:cation diffusion facilitator family transporter [Rippkaea orientalis PCC 8801]|uniref:Cation diffusion facilitator family transporter n=1 Tax=Rippkaea orientalis (strain PCC 8801 / RF-1) TaxID=41431 RepID=B7JX98_RIPO1|nr:cation diffusion facilitator family transporter [Rippkaea orientalis]ACK67086.1 cation diffusion facilitator family transporter [Rippkaea orientalis PCC 8801]